MTRILSSERPLPERLRGLSDGFRRWLFRPYAPSPRQIPELNGLRVLLVLIVSWYHFWQQSWLTPHVGHTSLDFLVRSGYMPVDGTIFLSGFLLFLPHARTMVLGERAPDLRGFYQRRVMRIVPSYYFVTLLMLLALALPGLWSNANPGYAFDSADWELWRGWSDQGPVMSLEGRLDWIAGRYGGSVLTRLGDWMFCLMTMAALLYLLYVRARLLRGPAARFPGPDQGWTRRCLSAWGFTAGLIAALAVTCVLFWLLMSEPFTPLSEKLAVLPERFRGDSLQYARDWLENVPAAFHGNTALMWEDVVRHLTFTQTFNYATYVGTPIGVASWTIAIEMQFYLIFPLLARGARKNPLAVFAIMAAIAFGFRSWGLWAMEDFNMVVNQLPNFLDAYAMGMAASLVYVKLTTLWSKERWLQLLWSIAATALLLTAFWGLTQLLRVQAGSSGTLGIQGGQMIRRPVFAALMAQLTLTLPFALRPVRFLMGNRLMGFLAMVSMNYYLIHQNFAVYLKQRLQLPFSHHYPSPNMPSPERPWADQYMALCFIGSLLLAAGITFLIEKPFAWLLGMGFRKINMAADRLLEGIVPSRRKKVS